MFPIKSTGRLHIEIATYRLPSTVSATCRAGMFPVYALLKVEYYLIFCVLAILVIIYFHGHSCHFQSASEVAALFNAEGYDFVGYDQRGHGNSSGLATYLPNFFDLLEDALSFVKKVRATYPGKRIFALGESMGALLALCLAKDNDRLFDAMLLISPFLGIKRPLPGTHCLIQGVSCLCPKLSFNFKKNPPKDPLRHSIIRVGTINTLLNGAKSLLRRMQEVRTDFQAIVGVKDKFISSSLVE